ncbi:phosphatase 2C-like domain-containing protein [Schizophyllum fasciatum]
MASKQPADLFHHDEDEPPATYTALKGAALDAAFRGGLNALGAFDRTHFASFQPGRERSQDRVVVENIAIGDDVWRLRCIFDGHAGHAAVDYIQQAIVPALRARLAAVEPAPQADAAAVSAALSSALLAIDDAIGRDARELFPPDIALLSDAQILEIADDHKGGGPGTNHEKLLRAKSGSTALVALVDPRGARLWVASLGDCTAALCTREERGGPWRVERLSANHNGVDPEEAARVRAEHPGEEEAMLNDRVVGTIAVTRGASVASFATLGDFFCKHPAAFVRRVLVASDPIPKFSATTLDGFLARLRTPPYVSALPEVRCVRLGLRGDVGPADQLLVMFSDGLPECVLDDFSDPEPYLRILPRILDRALDAVARHGGDDSNSTLDAGTTSLDSSPASPATDPATNLAAAIVRETLAGGEEYHPVMQAVRDGGAVAEKPSDAPLDHAERDDRLSQLLTVDIGGKWMDDVTAVVYRLR